MVEAHKSLTYTSMVSRELVRIALAMGMILKCKHQIYRIHIWQLHVLKRYILHLGQSLGKTKARQQSLLELFMVWHHLV